MYQEEQPYYQYIIHSCLACTCLPILGCCLACEYYCRTYCYCCKSIESDNDTLPS